MQSDEGILSRRDFLKGSAAAVAALSAGLLAEARAQETPAPSKVEPMNVGFIGVGTEGAMLLGKVLRVPGVKVTAVCDIYPKNLKNGLNIAKGAESYTDYRALVDRKDLQAIMIATPLDLHAPMAIAALQSGKHVFTEKLMAHSIDDAKKMARLALDSRKVLQIGHQRRYSPNYAHALDLINKGVIGKVTHVRAQWNRNGSWRRACPDKSLERLINWRMYRDRSQGLMAELGSHQLHVVNWFLGMLPTAVVGLGGIDYWKDGREVYDNVEVIYEYANGVRVNYTSLTTNQYDDCYEQFMGDKGTLVCYAGKGLLFQEPKADQLAWSELAHTEKIDGKTAILLDASATKKADDAKKAAPGQVASAISKDDYLTELEDFFACIRENRQPLCDGRAGLGSCVAAIKANEAIAKGTKIKLGSDLYQI